MAALVKQSLVDQIYIELRSSIVTQKIPWGERLNVSELQQKFEISSTPIREALNRLQKEGHVEYKNNFGAKVIDISEKDMIEIQVVALTLDCAAIKYAMETGKLGEIAEELSEKIKCYQEASDEAVRFHCIEEFTDIFYKYTGNERLISLSHAIKGQQSMLRSTYVKIKNKPSSMEDHIKIYHAVLSGNRNEAIQAMEDNYKKATELLLKVFE